MRRCFTIGGFGLFLALLAFGNQAFAATTQYTSIEPQNCHKPLETTPPGLRVQECPAPSGYRLFVVASDPRSWINIAKRGQVWSTEEIVAYRDPIGFFPSVDDSRVVEWRLDDRGRPTALIFRVTALDPQTNQSRHLSRLFVIRLNASKPCLLGIVATNEAARALTNDPKACQVPLEVVSGPFGDCQ